MSDPKAVGGEADRIAAILERDANMLRETGWPNVPENMQSAASLLRSQALEIQKAQAARAKLTDMIAQWRETARLARPLETAALTAEKRERIAKWMMYSNRASELEAALASPSLPTEIPEKTDEKTLARGGTTGSQ